jgi:RNA polymerase sigma-70 factor (ECF subfamily)
MRESRKSAIGLTQASRVLDSVFSEGQAIHMRDGFGAGTELDDGFLDRMRAGDESVIDALIERHGRRLFREAERVGLDGEQHVLDVVVQVWIARLGIREGVHGYLAKVHRSLVWKHIHRPQKRKAELVSLHDEARSLPTTASDPRIEELRQAAERVLSQDEKRVLDVRLMDENSVEQTAASLGISAATVKRRTSQIHSKLKEAMGVPKGGRS